MMIQKITTALVMIILLAVTSPSWSQNKKETTKRYKKVSAGYVMVLRQGDNVLQQLQQLAKQEGIPSANFTGMGFVDATFGFFDAQTKKYNPKEFKGVELASMMGTIAWKNKEVSIHSHAVVTDQSFQAFGGHLLEATVGTGSVEIVIFVHNKSFERQWNETLGADVLTIDK